MKLVIENAGARKGYFIMKKKNSLVIQAEGRVDNKEVTLLQSLPVEPPGNQAPLLPLSIVHYVERTQEPVVLNDVIREQRFIRDTYILEHHPKSIICAPIVYHSNLVGIIYLENDLTTGAFTADRLEVLRILSTQAAISIDNAGLYAHLEEKVEERTQELKQRHAQLIQSEKMASLATLVSGAAHELNNPNNFIQVGVANLSTGINDFKKYFFESLLQDEDQEFRVFFSQRLEPIFKSLTSISEGSKRIQKIVKGLRSFSRIDEAKYKVVNIVDCLESALFLVQANYHTRVQFDCDFQFNPQLQCHPAELNQAFMNIMINACQAIVQQQRQSADLTPGTLTISTDHQGDGLCIRFQDTGCGISQEIQTKIFEPFFTTRCIGEGTGLGLAIVFGTIQNHQGKITVKSEVEKGTIFYIYLPIQKQD